MIGQTFIHPVDQNIYRVREKTDKGNFKCVFIAEKLQDGSYTCLLDTIGRYKHETLASRGIIESNLVNVSVTVRT